jgi:predicted transposase YdaD
MAALEERGRLQGAEEKGMEKGLKKIVKNAMEMKMPVSQIERLTGLNGEEIEKLLRS